MKRRNFIFILPGFILVKRALPEPMVSRAIQSGSRVGKSFPPYHVQAARQYNEAYANILHTLTEHEGLVSLEQANRLYFK